MDSAVVSWVMMRSYFVVTVALLALACAGDDSSADSAADASATETAESTEDESTDSASSDSSSDSGETTESTSDETTESTSGETTETDSGTDTGGELGDPAVFQTPDRADVCQPTPDQPCTPSDMGWAIAEYGVELERVDGGAIDGAGRGYRVIELAEDVGPSNLNVYVLDEQGEPLVGVPVAFYYSTAPDDSLPNEPYPVKVTGYTEAGGRVGFALGPGAYLSECGGGGPHAIWVSEPDANQDPALIYPTDLVDRLGMLGGTEHRHLDIVFQRVTAGDALSLDAVACPL